MENRLTMLGWEQIGAGQKLHAFQGHDMFPVCGNKDLKRSVDDVFPRTTYRGPMPPLPEMICETCRMYERDNDPMFKLGRAMERGKIVQLLRREANRIFGSQGEGYPSNILDTVALNLSMHEDDEISRAR
jgi:hypothetical protein